VRSPQLTPLAAAVLHVPAPERALLIGCGDGEAALFLAREFPAARVRAVDSSAAAVRACQARVGLDPEGRIAFKNAGPGDLPYPDHFFDLVAQVGERVAAGEMARVLRPGGHYLLAPTRLPRLAAGAREKLLRARLARHQITIERIEAAGDGKFFVARSIEPR
jgi:ubiquinone/menaquinone biosynthesis C-methylase UbiE